MIDLHVHSTRSDGSYTPSELVDYAIEKGLKAFALTDHDTVAGLDEAIDYARKLKEQGIDVPKVIPGIEFSTEHNGKEVHVVGLFVDYKSKAFTDYLAHFVESRDNRNKKMCEVLCEAGFDMPYETMVKEFSKGVLTRAHFAQYMLKKGYVKSYSEAFDRYIGDRAPYFIPKEKVTPEMAIDLILKSDGIPIFAHPILCHLSHNNLCELVKRLKDAGLMGIEAIYSTYETADEREIREIANEYHLLLSGGSDFHGTNKKGIDLGVGGGKLYVPDDFLDEMMKHRKNVLFTDLDGTLLLKDCTISPEMKAAIDKMVENGHRIVMTSGRPLPSMLERKKALGFDYPNSYIISYNGGLIYDCDKEETIFSNKLSPEIIKVAEEICNRNKVHLHCYTEHHIVGYEDDDELKYYRIRIKMPFIDVESLSGYLINGTYKIQIISLDNKPLLEKVQAEIMEALAGRVDSFFSNDKYLEILPPGCNKGAGVKFLSEYLAIPNSHVFASGDENNDIPMIKYAGHGIAVANAAPSVKEAADIITKEDNEHNGLLEIINTYFK